MTTARTLFAGLAVFAVAAAAVRCGPPPDGWAGAGREFSIPPPGMGMAGGGDAGAGGGGDADAAMDVAVPMMDARAPMLDTGAPTDAHEDH